MPRRLQHIRANAVNHFSELLTIRMNGILSVRCSLLPTFRMNQLSALIWLFRFLHKVLCILQFPQTQLFLVILINNFFSTITTKHAPVTIKLGSQHNVVESGTFVIDIGFVQTRHEDNLDPAVVLEETVGDLHGDVMDLILPTIIESNVARGSL